MEIEPPALAGHHPWPPIMRPPMNKVLLLEHSSEFMCVRRKPGGGDPSEPPRAPPQAVKVPPGIHPGHRNFGFCVCARGHVTPGNPPGHRSPYMLYGLNSKVASYSCILYVWR